MVATSRVRDVKPPKQVAVKRGGKKKGKKADDIAPEDHGNSVTLMDLQLHTEEEDMIDSIMAACPELETPPRIFFLHRQSRGTDFTYCCEARFESADQAQLALSKQAFTIGDIDVAVKPYDGTEVPRGPVRLYLSKLEFKTSPEAFRVLRRLFHECESSDIEIMRTPGKSDELEGKAEVTFRTMEGAKKARDILERLKEAEGIKWGVGWVITPPPP